MSPSPLPPPPGLPIVPEPSAVRSEDDGGGGGGSVMSYDDRGFVSSLNSRASYPIAEEEQQQQQKDEADRKQSLSPTATFTTAPRPTKLSINTNAPLRANTMHHQQNHERKLTMSPPSSVTGRIDRNASISLQSIAEARSKVSSARKSPVTKAQNAAHITVLRLLIVGELLLLISLFYLCAAFFQCISQQYDNTRDDALAPPSGATAFVFVAFPSALHFASLITIMVFFRKVKYDFSSNNGNGNGGRSGRGLGSSRRGPITGVAGGSARFFESERMSAFRSHRTGVFPVTDSQSRMHR
jgi:hypothetical protein